MAKILLLAANSSERTRWQVERYARELSRLLRATRFASHLEVIHEAGAATGAAAAAIAAHRPEVVHFVGRGEGRGEVVLSDASGPMDVARAVEPLRRAAGAVLCVVLDGCWSPPLANALTLAVECVVAVPAAIDDDGSISFADAFYRALGFGLSLAKAYELGENQLEQRRTAGAGALRLSFRPGIDPGKVILPPPSSVPPPPASVPPSSIAPPSGRLGQVGPPSQRPRLPSTPPASAPGAVAYALMRPLQSPSSLLDQPTQAVKLLDSVPSPAPWREVAVVPFAAGVRKPLDPGSILGAARGSQPMRRTGAWAGHPFFPWLDLGPRPEAGTDGLLWRFSGSRGFDGIFTLGFDGSFVQRELVRELSHPNPVHGAGVGLFATLDALAGALLFARRLAAQFPDYGRAWVVLRLGLIERARLILDYEDGHVGGGPKPPSTGAKQAVVGAGGYFRPNLATPEVTHFCGLMGAELAAFFDWNWDAAGASSELFARLSAAVDE